MFYLVALAFVAVALIGPGATRSLGRAIARGLRPRTPGSWRPGVGVLALACVIAALAAGVRGEWPLAGGGILLASAAALVARRRAAASAPREPGPSRREAADLLGVDANAGEAQIRAAHARLIRVAHPDRGGTAALAAHLNAARDVLLGRS